MKPLPPLFYIGDVLVGVVSDCDCPAPVYPGDGPACVPDHPHEAHDIVPVRAEFDLPEGVDFEDYKAWCRMFAAAPKLLAALERLLGLPLLRWDSTLTEPEREAKRLAIAAVAAARPPEGRPDA